MVFNVTFNNISVISWKSVLLMEETGENHRPAASHWQTLSLNVVWVHLTMNGVRTHNFSADPITIRSGPRRSPLSLLMLIHSISEIKGSIYKLQINMSITRMLHHCYHFLHVRIVQINQRGSILVSHVYLHPYPFFLIDCQSLSFCCMELVKHFPVLMVYSLVYTIMDVVCIADFKQY